MGRGGVVGLGGGRPGAAGGKSPEGGEDMQNDPGQVRGRAGQRRMVWRP